MDLLSFIVWDPIPEVIPSWSIPRWYGLFFAVGFLISQQIMFYFFRKDGRPEKDVETMTIYMVVATILGARFGHVFFYEPEIFLNNPIDVINFWDGGFSGLASHGGAVGILLALYIYSRRHTNQSYLWVLDRIVIVVALTGCLIRTGNLMNSEIIGKPTDSSLGFVFARSAEEAVESLEDYIDDVEASQGTHASAGNHLSPVDLRVEFKKQGLDEAAVKKILNYIQVNILSQSYVKQHIRQAADQPLDYSLDQEKGQYIATIHTQGVVRYPTQLFEAIFYLLTFAVLFLIWQKARHKLPEGFIFSLFLVILFGFRFFIEFLKENQVAFEDDIPLNMGQWLSIPLVLTGAVLMVVLLQKQNKKDKEIAS
ncbi:prolipoprotein diacylglyceryl transferase [Rapidithrix thailandica]|uniref:Phosphatidylglycerol--prolipoprotein diacylglyceryl transferase n=1 Tax=Rapidithrix thailandica TaxID=413964 RepID=A0AAW9RPK9_9BACT